MTRLYHSPSSVELGRRCEYAWALCYLEGLRDPEVKWEDIEAGRIVATFEPRGPGQCSYKQRAASLGVAVHAIGESYFDGSLKQFPDTLPGRIYESGLQHLPVPRLCMSVETEVGIGREPSGADDPDKPQTVRVINGVRWAGYRDLRVQLTPSEYERLTIPDFLGKHSPWVLYDYKTTSSISKWAKSADDLRRDLQCNLYALDSMLDLDLDRLACRWLYLETKESRRSRPVDVVITRDDASKVVASYADTCHRLDSLERVADALKNTAACGDYGGCSYHKSRGGPCDAIRDTGSLIQARKKASPMAGLSEEKKAQLKAKFGGGAKVAPAEDTAPAVDEQGEVVIDEQPETKPEAETKTEATVAPPATKPAAKRTAAVKSTAAGSTARIIELAQKRAGLEAEIAAINTEIAGLVS